MKKRGSGLLDHPDEARSILQKAAQFTPEVAAKVWERTNLSNSKIGSDPKTSDLRFGQRA